MSSAFWKAFKRSPFFFLSEWDHRKRHVTDLGVAWNTSGQPVCRYMSWISGDKNIWWNPVTEKLTTKHPWNNGFSEYFFVLFLFRLTVLPTLWPLWTGTVDPCKALLAGYICDVETEHFSSSSSDAVKRLLKMDTQNPHQILQLF